ncbi:hypothetical protein DKG77_15355 [Flagellimonas aquimarina]|uniref:FecR family protein n=1 Tax=Flagellimonas aquimarina TaxID=2201895 RepID=A0A316KV97_9FLAO|nr:FecR domain-containing protein [Allomuricauda koreensis]PWL37674.1 hypothetical protein DKG77_15355 [Allomuricauda koreensis]
MNSKIDIIISKFLDDEASEAEKAFLIEWTQTPENRAYFEDFIKTEIWVKYSFNASDVEKHLSMLSIVTRSKRKKTHLTILKYAALFIAIFTSAAFIYFSKDGSDFQVLDQNTISLEINNGSSRYFSLEDYSGFTLKDKAVALKTNGVLEYLANSKQEKESNNIEYHTINVPYGKTFKVNFADGTQVHLNSGSKLTYPKNFNGSDLREVSLVGEAYFKVAKANVPFQVNVEGLSTKVLGTEFNVSAYQDEIFKEVILVEGSVQVFQNYKGKGTSAPKLMVPSQRAIGKNADIDLIIENVDIANHIAWMDGVLVFENENLPGIIKILERRFNIDIKNNYERLDEMRYSGRFKNENIDEILKTMQAHTNFSYTLKGNILKIDKPN